MYKTLKNEISIFVLSYNFKDKIARCLDSILMQVTNIPIKIYCSDDGSNDGTQEILKKYADKNKKIIKLILSKKNTGNISLIINQSDLHCDSKYFCHLDGDDYWIDDLNIQKKIDILNRNHELIGCASITKMIDTKNNKTELIMPSKIKFNKLDMILHKNASFYCHASSIVWKNYYYNKNMKLPFPPNFVPGKDGDTFFFHQMLNQGHNIYFIPKIMSVYDYSGRGIWSKLSIEEQRKINKKLKLKIFYYSKLSYKFYYILRNVFKIDSKFKSFYKIIFKFTKQKPVNI
jgi:glycosyltransferase involved in cell wall biosynthesis